MFAQTGSAELPTSQVMEKQRVVLEELRHKLDLDLENFDKLSIDELREIVDRAVGSVSLHFKVHIHVYFKMATHVCTQENNAMRYKYSNTNNFFSIFYIFISFLKSSTTILHLCAVYLVI